MPRRPRVNWDEAFAFYASLGPTRSFATVGDKFAVSREAVGRHARAERWEERARALDRRAAARAEKKVERTRADRIADQIAVTDAARIEFARQLASGAVPIRGRDIAALARVEALLEGEATERIVREREDVRTELERWFKIAREQMNDEQYQAFLDALEVDATEGDETP